MKINELNIPTPISKAAGTYYRKLRTHDDSQADFEEKLEKYGWKYHDGGAYSNVYTNSRKPYVLKINTEFDPAFQRFVNLIKKYPNKHFPQISDMKEYKVGRKKYYIYMIEKLYKVKDQFISSLIRDYTDYNGDDLENIDTDYLEYLNKHKDFWAALNIIIKNQKDYEIDLHNDNFMKRKNGTIVLTDPYSIGWM